ncbi:MAG: alpha/beta hydrolase, partial [Gammaproteobacteria bacterium]|nr:alpha/beta hydrolase [Gammaproteobacteria bacterium]
DSDAADRVCNADPVRVFDVMMRKNVITRERFDTLPKSMRSFSLLKALSRRELRGEPLLSDDESTVYATAFSNSGFTGPINWYRNWTRNWKSTADVEQSVRTPTLFIGARNDVIVTEKQIAAMPDYVPDLETHILEACGHWSQQERPDAVNALLVDWLQRRQQPV